jgi:hypothetical protein
MADVSEEDMQAAVASGVLDERQAARLKAFADARRMTSPLSFFAASAKFLSPSVSCCSSERSPRWHQSTR